MDLSEPLPEPDGLGGVPLDAAGVAQVHAWVVSADPGETSWELVRSLEELKNAVTARQAEVTVALHQQQLIDDTARGLVKPGHTDRVVAAQLGLARRRSSVQGWRLLRAAHLTVSSDPVRDAMRAGVVGEDQAAMVDRETEGLSGADRDAVMEQVAPMLGQVSDPHLRDELRAQAHRVDPDLSARRARVAREQRRVTLRPARDGAAYLSAFLPAVDAKEGFEALRQTANQPPHGQQPTGEGADAEPARTPRQRMADLLVARLTGRDPLTHPPQVRLNVLIPIDALTGPGREPAYLPGYGPLPASEAAALLAENPVIRRLFTDPDSGQLISMESTARRYRGLLAQFVRWRDRRCRSPFCGAAIRDIDHIRPHAAGGPTDERNAEAYCSRCNQVKEHPAWSVTGDAARTITRSGGILAETHPPAAAPARRPEPRNSEPDARGPDERGPDERGPGEGEAGEFTAADGGSGRPRVDNIDHLVNDPQWQHRARRARQAGAAAGVRILAARARAGTPRPPSNRGHDNPRRRQLNLPELSDDPPG